MKRSLIARHTVLVGGAASTLMVASAPGTAFAHHGITGTYDRSTPIILFGQVTRAVFAPPHPEITLLVEAFEGPLPDVNRPDEFTGPFVARPEDVGQERDIEFSPVGTSYGLADRLNKRDRVLILALQNCRSPRRLRSSWISLANGDIISYDRGLHRRADGCA